MNDWFTAFGEVFKRAKYYYLMALISSMYISFKSDFYTAFFANIVLNYFATLIGTNEILLEIKGKLIRASTGLNTAHYNQLVNDTEVLKQIEKNLVEAKDIGVSVEKLRFIISDNLEVINRIKSISNGDYR
jgi:hypothetical protein